MTAKRDWHSEPEPTNLDPLEDGRLRPLHDKASPLRTTLAILGGLLILGVVLYGLNRPHAENEINASRPAPATTGAAPQQQAPAQDQATKGPGQSGQPGGQPSGAQGKAQ